MSGLWCRIFGHVERPTVSHGDYAEMACKRCKARQVYLDGMPLPPAESEAKSAEMWRYAEGIRWLLDNVEPTHSVGRAAAIEPEGAGR